MKRRCVALAGVTALGGCLGRVPHAAAPPEAEPTYAAPDVPGDDAHGVQAEDASARPDRPSTASGNASTAATRERDRGAAAAPETLHPPTLDRASSAAGEPPRYVLLPDVDLPAEIAPRVARIADAYFRRTGRTLVLTSGTRDAEHQARAMCEVMRLAGGVLRLYKNRAAAREIERAYEDARVAGRSTEDAVARVLRAQMDRGVFVSAHLRAGAVDVRSYDMTPADRRAFVDSAREVAGAQVLEESAPPHFHLQLDEPLRAGARDDRRAGDPE